MIKKIMAVGGLGVFLLMLAVAASDTKSGKLSVSAEDTQTEMEMLTDNTDDSITNSMTEASYQEALKRTADLRFWYDDASYEAYFTSKAAEYYEETGVLAELVYIDDIDYVGDIYDVTMQDGAFPDVYLLSGEELEKAHLYGVAGENVNEEDYAGVVSDNALIASQCHDKMFGYPLSYNVCLLAYNNQYFETAPESLQAIIDYSDDNEPDENVQYLLEWDAYDPFFGFLFVSESVVLDDEGIGVLEATYDEALLEQSLLFLEESLASFSLPIDTVTEESVLEDLMNGTTLCAIIDSDSMKELQGASYDICEFPRLNEELDAQSAALTDMLLVNDYSTKQEEASAFAQYLTLENYESLWEMTGHYPVKLQSDADEKERTAYHAYEKAIPAPNSQDAGGFWIYIKEMITDTITEQY